MTFTFLLHWPFYYLDLPITITFYDIDLSFTLTFL